MKNLLSLICLLPLSVAAMAQNTPKQFKVADNSTFDCLYNYSVKGVNQDGVEFCDEFTTILQAGERVAKFWDYGAYKVDSILYFSDSNEEIIIEAQSNLVRQEYYYDAEILQNFPKGKITENGIIGVTYYTYNEPQKNLKWTLHSDTLTVMKTLCNRATAEFGGREWTAWYAPSIPASYGPWKLSGLPGLILKAEEDSGTHCFEAFSIRKDSQPIYNDTSKLRTKASKAQYLKAKVIHELDPANIPADLIQDISISKNGDKPAMYINGILVRKHLNGYHSLEVVELKESEIPKPKDYSGMTVTPSGEIVEK